MSTKILIVEDDRNINLMIQLILKNKRLDWELRSARDGREALDVLKNFPAAVVLTDISMPTMNGIELIQKLRSLPDWSHGRVAVLTSESEETLLRQVRAAGVDALWRKPITAETLFANLEELLRKSLPG